jgi:hypothetical protein
VTARAFSEEITDPVTGEVVTLRATAEAELDGMVSERFGIGREDREAGSADPAASGVIYDVLVR